MDQGNARAFGRCHGLNKSNARPGNGFWSLSWSVQDNGQDYGIARLIYVGTMASLHSFLNNGMAVRTR